MKKEAFSSLSEVLTKGSDADIRDFVLQILTEYKKVQSPMKCLYFQSKLGKGISHSPTS